MRAGAAALVSAIALLAPAAADATLPAAGTWWNGSQARGGYLETTPHTVRTLWLFCRSERFDDNAAYNDFRASRYEVPFALHVRRDGTFSWHGHGYRRGAESQTLPGQWKIRVRGRFVTPRKVRIKRTLEGCGTATTTVELERGS